MEGKIVYCALTHAIVLGRNGIEYFIEKPIPCKVGDLVTFDIDTTATRLVSACNVKKINSNE